MNENINYYELLGVSKNATKDEIKKAYRIQAKKWHPDLNKDEQALEISKKINEAKVVLLDDLKRKDYDDYLNNLANKKYQKMQDDNIKNTNSKSTYSSSYSEEYSSEKTYTKWEYFQIYYLLCNKVLMESFENLIIVFTNINRHILSTNISCF